MALLNYSLWEDLIPPGTQCQPRATWYPDISRENSAELFSKSDRDRIRKRPESNLISANPQSPKTRCYNMKSLFCLEPIPSIPVTKSRECNFSFPSPKALVFIPFSRTFGRSGLFRTCKALRIVCILRLSFYVDCEVFLGSAKVDQKGNEKSLARLVFHNID